jgi:hypothetical protein
MSVPVIVAVGSTRTLTELAVNALFRVIHEYLSALAILLTVPSLGVVNPTFTVPSVVFVVLGDEKEPSVRLGVVVLRFVSVVM